MVEGFRFGTNRDCGGLATPSPGPATEAGSTHRDRGRNVDDLDLRPYPPGEMSELPKISQDLAVQLGWAARVAPIDLWLMRHGSWGRPRPKAWVTSADLLLDVTVVAKSEHRQGDGKMYWPGPAWSVAAAGCHERLEPKGLRLGALRL